MTIVGIWLLAFTVNGAAMTERFTVASYDARHNVIIASSQYGLPVAGWYTGSVVTLAMTGDTGQSIAVVFDPADKRHRMRVVLWQSCCAAGHAWTLTGKGKITRTP